MSASEATRNPATSALRARANQLSEEFSVGHGLLSHKMADWHRPDQDWVAHPNRDLAPRPPTTIRSSADGQAEAGLAVLLAVALGCPPTISLEIDFVARGGGELVWRQGFDLP